MGCVDSPNISRFRQFVEVIKPCRSAEHHVILIVGNFKTSELCEDLVGFVGFGAFVLSTQRHH